MKSPPHVCVRSKIRLNLIRRGWQSSTMKPWSRIFLLLLLRASIILAIKIESDGGYTDIVIKIRDEVPEDKCPKILQNLKVKKPENSFQSLTASKTFWCPQKKTWFSLKETLDFHLRILLISPYGNFRFHSKGNFWAPQDENFDIHERKFLISKKGNFWFLREETFDFYERKLLISTKGNFWFPQEETFDFLKRKL